MDAIQIANGTAALVSAVAVHVAFKISPGLGSAASHYALLLVITWYSIINLGLGFGLLEIGDATPYFRLAFAPLMALYAWRHALYIRYRLHG